MVARRLLLWLALALTAPVVAEVRVDVGIGIGLPNVTIGIRVPVYQHLEPIPGYPAYYAPRLRANYFFYDGMYWVYEDDDWYASDWYDGPWYRVDRYAVPVLVLRIPVRYYRSPPRAFRGWLPDAPPRWNDHWGRRWAKQRHGWERDLRPVTYQRPPPPTYQRAYSGARYPRGEQQRRERERHYRYVPREPVIREHHAPHRAQRPPRAPPPRVQQAPRVQQPSRAQPHAPRDDRARDDRGGRNEGRPNAAGRHDDRSRGDGEPQRGHPAKDGRGRGD